MHTLHWWAVEAEDKEEAMGVVSNRLINEDGANFVDWSDWHVVGGGRWSDSQYEDSSNMITFLERIKTDKFISDMVDYISNSGLPNDEQRFDMNSYYVRKAGDLLSDIYTSDSYFYDMVEYTAHMGYIKERLDDPAKKMLQFLVPVDFHF
jgi:hypothetical protein